MPIRAAIYARFSSDMQRSESIDDQIAVCRRLAELHDCEIVKIFSDQATSGASSLRSGYQAMLQAARRGEFDVLIAEALDRLSRDMEDIAALYKAIKFAGGQILTRSEGEITELHVGLKGTMNALFLKDLALKTHRGLRGRAEAGKSAGGLCFGYKVVRALGPNGELTRGDRSIDPGEAAVVRRIFQMFADGSSPIAIAKALNGERLPGPHGHAWRDTTIRGHAIRGTGILRNELYVGRLVWNRMHFMKDPATGKRVSRMNPRPEWVIEDVTQLRIVDQDLWDRVEQRLGNIREASGANAPDRPKFWEKRRSKHLLTGKIRCGVCGGAFSAVGTDLLACTTARRQGLCSNREGIRRPVLDELVLTGLRSHLMQPEHVGIFVADVIEEWNRLQADVAATADSRTRELESVRQKLSNLVDAIAGGLNGPTLQRKLDELERRQSELEEQLQHVPAPAPALHPNLAEIYREKVAKLHEVLRTGAESSATLEAARSLIERVVLHPRAGSKGLEIELIGEISAMLDIAMDRDVRRGSTFDRGLFARSVKVVAGKGNHRELVPISVQC